MKKRFRRLTSLLLCGILLSTNTVTAEDNVSVTLSRVYAKYGDEQPKDYDLLF